MRVYLAKVEESMEEEFSRSQVILHKDNKPEILHTQTFDRNVFFNRRNNRKCFYIKNARKYVL